MRPQEKQAPSAQRPAKSEQRPGTGVPDAGGEKVDGTVLPCLVARSCTEVQQRARNRRRGGCGATRRRGESPSDIRIATVLNIKSFVKRNDSFLPIIAVSETPQKNPCF